MIFERTYRVVKHTTGENAGETIVFLECDDSNVPPLQFEMKNEVAKGYPVNDIVRVVLP